MRAFATPPAALPRDVFVKRFGGVYEHSPWVAERAHAEGLDGVCTPEELSARMHAQVEAADREAQLALLRAHPDLAGKLALAGGLGRESAAEQAGAGLDQCSPQELEEFTALNDRYQARFGFPYIIAVRGRNRAQILEDFRARVENDPEVEFTTALEQVRRIALLRLEAMEA